jgi:flagellar biosynthesis GTPase FlhF
MAKNVVSKTAFLNKAKKNAKGGWKKAREAEAKAKGSSLPDGLVNAVAKLISIKGDFDTKGNPYFMFQGLVKAPEECSGLKCHVFHRLVESKDPKTKKVYKTVQDKLDSLSSDMQLLGIDTEPLEDLDQVYEALAKRAKEKPHFNFNTWKPDNGSVQIFIQGLTDEADIPEDEEAEEEEEESEEEEDSEEEEEEEEKKPAKKKPKPKAKEEEEEEEEEAEEKEEEEEEEEEKPKAKPKKKPAKPAKDEEEEEEEEEEESEEEEEEWEPKKGEAYNYKNGKAKPALMKIIMVNDEKKTVSLKDKAGAILKGIPWSKLESAED